MFGLIDWSIFTGWIGLVFMTVGLVGYAILIVLTLHTRLSLKKLSYRTLFSCNGQTIFEIIICGVATMLVFITVTITFG